MAKTITYQQAISDTLRQEMERDSSVFVIGEDVRISPFGQTAGLAAQFGPERVRNTCIAENAIAGLAIGAAMTGMRPVAEIMFADFMYLAMDQIATQAASWRYMTGGQVKLPLVIRTAAGGGWAMGYNHSQCTEASFMHAPGLRIAIPSTPRDAAGLLRTAIREDNPVLFFEHKGLLASTGEVPDEEFSIPFGQADIKRAGKDVTIVATLMMVQKALAAAEKLSQEGIEVEVIDPRTLKPLDKDTILASVKKTGRLVTVEESRIHNGVGAEIAAMVVSEGFDLLDAPVQRVAAPDVPIPCSPALEQVYLPNEETIIAAVKKVLQ
jgi:acetoin:2,6-dichlorophenolindophenol oxidoreductase subunit beta